MRYESNQWRSLGLLAMSFGLFAACADDTIVAQECVVVAPPDVVGIVSFEDPSALATLVVDNAEVLRNNDSIKALLIPSLFESEDDFQETVDFLIARLETIAKSDYLTCFVSPELECVIVVKFSDDQALQLGEWNDGVPSALRSLMDVPFRAGQTLGDEIEPVLSQFPDLVTIQECNAVVLGRKGGFLDKIRARLVSVANGEVPGALLIDERCFNRAYRPIEDTTNQVVFAWLVPDVIARFNIPGLSHPGNAYEIDEFVGCCVSVKAVSPEGKSQQAFSARCVLPCTVPKTGVSAMWDSYQPIDQIPPIAWFVERSEPIRLRVQSRDSDIYFQQQRAIYDREHGEGAFDQFAEEAYRNVGGFDVWRNRHSGLQLQYWYQGPKRGGDVIQISRLKDRQSAIQFQKYVAEFKFNRNKALRMTETEIDDAHVAWFLTEKDARARFEHNHERTAGEDEHVSNFGSVIGPDWEFEGEKKTLLSFLEHPTDKPVWLDDELDGVADVSIFRVLDEFVPGWIEVNWPEGRRNLVANWRMEYLRAKYPSEAIKILAESRFRDLPHMTPRDNQDRLFAITEFLAAYALTRHEFDVMAFSSDQSSVQWQWMLVLRNGD